MEMKIKNKLERIGMEQKALALPYSEEDIKQYFPEKEHLTLKVINSFVEENQGELYFDIANRPIGLSTNEQIYRNLFAIFDKENEKKFLELMKYTDPDLSPVAHMIYSKEARAKIFEKSKIIHNYFEEKGQKVSISKLSNDYYLFSPINKRGYGFENRDSYNLRIKDNSKILNEMWFRNSRKMYAIEDIVC
mgnify:CR=1 FL=1